MILQGDRGWYGLELHASSTLAVTGCHWLSLAGFWSHRRLGPQTWPPLPICLQFRVGPRGSL